MSELADLYQEIILDHNRRPRNYRDMPECTCSAEGNNPLCGDEVKVFVRVDEGKLSDVSFLGQGCAISKASASLMTAKTRGRSGAEARNLATEVRTMLLGPEEAPPSGLGDIVALSGVRKFPARIKCAMLPWHALEAALDGQQTATTE
ncbi:MAG: SUF system NifU family Fe-S cluster assembly protein [Chthoniobacterales bacterium]|nr:SUF system NifU family Fe-S cluster assembly protein [Chthoniobacterales bacterium]